MGEADEKKEEAMLATENHFEIEVKPEKPAKKSICTSKSYKHYQSIGMM